MRHTPSTFRLSMIWSLSRFPILYKRILCHREISYDQRQTLWNINLNVPAHSMKGILMLFEDARTADVNYGRNTELYHDPKITKVEVTIEWVTNQLYSQGLQDYQQWDEVRKYFASGNKRHPEASMVLKDLQLADVSLDDYFTIKYALWLDLCTTDDDQLHGTGRRIESTSEGVTIQITKTAEAAGPLNMYLYIILDEQLNIENGCFVSEVY